MFRRIIIAVAVAVLGAASITSAQSTDIATYQLKLDRAASAPPPQPMYRGLVMPTEQTAGRPYFGFRLILGGAYEPSIFPDDTWINIACVAHDTRVKWDREEFGSNLIRVHALIYELDQDGSLNTDTVYSTVDTTESDEAICDLAYGADSSFIEIPRTFKAAVVSLFSVAGTRQYVEVVEIVERALAP